jgi:hypothetical protein
MARTRPTVVPRVAVAVVAIGVTVAAFPQAAQAAPASRHCSETACSVTATGFPGGGRALYVDVDVAGSNPLVGTVDVWKDGSSTKTCSFTIPAGDPIRSYRCGSSPAAGTYKGVVAGRNAPSAIGLRW